MPSRHGAAEAPTRPHVVSFPRGPRSAVGLRILYGCRWPLLLAAVILGPAHPHAHIAREIAEALRRV
jgi:hypothetical protein